jgi:hypothetical protein
MNVVVACTNRKTQPIPARLQLRKVRGKDPARRLDAWIQRLHDMDGLRTRAADLYAGESWEVTRTLLEGSSESPRSLWICSAGLGLLASDCAIPAYSATFEQSHPDAVPDGVHGAADWWTALGSWEGFDSGPRSLRALARCCPTARLIVVLSPPYLKACRSDLIAAANELDDPMQLSVISAGTKRDPLLWRHLLPVDARLQSKVGGTKHSLNIRTAAALLQSGGQTHMEMHQRLVRWLQGQPALTRFDRTPVTDDAVRQFIEDRLSSGEALTHSRTLREFRTSGFACEQSRFARLFQEVSCDVRVS